MEKMYKCIVRTMDGCYKVLYAYSTGKFYLFAIDGLSVPLIDKISETNGKIYLPHKDLCEIIENAIDPATVDYTHFSCPLVIGIMVTNKCNLTCKYCIANNGHSYSLKDNFFNIEHTVSKELRESSVVSVLVSGGEPTLYKNLKCFISNLSHEDFVCMLDTNGTHIDQSLIDILKVSDIIPRISLDSIHAEEHNVNRGMFEDTLKNIINMRSQGINLRINTVLNKYNYGHLFDLAEWICKNGIEKWHIFKLQHAFASNDMRLNDEQVINILTRLDELYGDRVNILFKFSKKNDGFSSFVIDSEGLCFSTQNGMVGDRKKHVFGDIKKNGLGEIWSNTPDSYRLRHYSKYLSYKNKEI